MINESDISDSAIRYITIPNGVKVIEVYATATSDAEISIERVFLQLTSNNKKWCNNDASSDTYYTDISGYVGVTPNKQYTLNLESDSRVGASITIDRFYIRYSPEINNKTPTIYDY